jgi:hypothetical protein
MDNQCNKWVSAGGGWVQSSPGWGWPTARVCPTAAASGQLAAVRRPGSQHGYTDAPSCHGNPQGQLHPNTGCCWLRGWGHGRACALVVLRGATVPLTDGDEKRGQGQGQGQGSGRAWAQ